MYAAVVEVNGVKPPHSVGIRHMRSLERGASQRGYDGVQPWRFQGVQQAASQVKTGNQASSDSAQLVSCIAPIALNERWQSPSS